MTVRKKKLQSIFLFSYTFCFLCFLLLFPAVHVHAAGKNVRASISADRVKIGRTLQITAKDKGVSYRSSDTTVATVSPDGRVTGKKQGTATISVRKKGCNTRKFSITVAANGRYPSVPVTLDETDIKVTGSKSKIQAVVKNNASAGTIRKIVYEYQAVSYHPTKQETETVSPSAVSYTTVWKKQKKTVKFTITAIAAGKSKKASVKGDFGDADRLELTLKSVKLYTGKLLLTYSKSGKVSLEWGVKDKTAPVITGWIGKDSYNSKDVFMVVYPDKKYDFTKYIKATDDRDGDIKVTADTGKVNWKKKGTYDIIFTATDKAGNQAKKKARVQVRTVGSLEKEADSILSRIIKNSWSDQAKAEAIYRYVRKNYSYVDSNDHASWENSALYGLRYHSGNCFVFYSLSRLLLTRCGIPNIEVKRSAGSIHGHWWNYVYIQDGWYHFDTTPRRIRAKFCLVTDEQLTLYSNAAGNSHIWDKSIIPQGATKAISKVVWGVSY